MPQSSSNKQYRPQGRATLVTNDSFGIKNKPVQTRRMCHTCYKWLVWHQKQASTNQKDLPHLLQMTRLASETSQYKPEGCATLVTNDSFGSRNRSSHDDVAVRPGTETQLWMTLSWDKCKHSAQQSHRNHATLCITWRFSEVKLILCIYDS